MKIAVLSGKGGAGKTFVASNLAKAIGDSVYVDCDVEEPNGALFLKPVIKDRESIEVYVPEFDQDKCDGCRKCVDFCRFNALVYIKNKPRLFEEVCHSCGGCTIVCPQNAVSEKGREIGFVETGRSDDVDVMTGILKTGEVSGVPIINSLIEKIDTFKKDRVIIDCPPGSACTVMESIADADYCILVTEPTAFGYHNFIMVYELASILGKKTGVVINKMDDTYEPLENFCRENDIKILSRIPYSNEVAGMIAEGKLPVNENARYRRMFIDIWDRIEGEII